ncbi:MAG: hypothetical protein PUD93_11905 [Lachnospiraceae bacterium]|nr:hypothetical protein [Lachnospiraceae bacterium]
MEQTAKDEPGKERVHMKLTERIKELESNLDLDLREALGIMEAVSEVFPMIVMANLTKNTYTMIRNDDFLAFDMPRSGCYDDLIDDGVENIHPNYQTAFLECFSRENLLRKFYDGKTEVYSELYQKGRDGKYQWVSTHVIRLQDEKGEIRQICLNRVLKGIVESRGGCRR